MRIDTIEQTLHDSGTLSGAVGPAGYLVAYALAEANLRLGCTVVAECVNPLAITRDAWNQVAHRAGAVCIDIEVTCSDPAEHRRRIEARGTDVPNLRLPTWDDVLAREYHAWTTGRIVLDTAGRSPADCLDELRSATSIVRKVEPP